MKIEFTEAEVAEIVKDFTLKLINRRDSAGAVAVEFDCAYGFLRKVVVTVKTVEDDSDA